MTVLHPKPHSSPSAPQNKVGPQQSTSITNYGRQAIPVMRAVAAWLPTAVLWLAAIVARLRDKAEPVTRRIWLVSGVRAEVAARLAAAVHKVRAVPPADASWAAGRTIGVGRSAAWWRQMLSIRPSAARVGVVALLVSGVAATSQHAAHAASAAAAPMLQALSTPAAAPPAAPDATAKAPSEPGPEYGIDVSNYNGNINWKNVAAHGKRFAFVLATDGQGFTNPLFRSQFDGAKDAGLLVGAYHFARPTASASDQADFLLSTINYAADGKILPPVLDLEVSPSDGGCYGLSAREMQDWVRTFSTRVKDATGTDVILYANASFWSQCMGDTDTFRSTNPLSLAAYVSGAPVAPGGWDHFTFWQNSQSGQVSGVSGPVDLDVFNGGLDQLKKFTQPSSK